MQEIYLFEGRCGSGVTTSLLKFASSFAGKNCCIVDLNHFTLGHKEKVEIGSRLLNVAYSSFVSMNIKELRALSAQRERLFIDFGDPEQNESISILSQLNHGESFFHCKVIDSRDLVSGFVSPQHELTGTRKYYFYTFTDRLMEQYNIFLDKAIAVSDQFWISNGPRIPEDLSPFKK